MNVDWSVLSRLYPVSDKSLFIKQSIAFGFFTFIILYFFRPFNIDDYSPYVLQVCMVYGGITGIVMLASGLIFHSLTGQYIDEDKWTVGKQILLYIIISAEITVANTLFYSWYWNLPIDIEHTLNMLARVVGISIWPVSISVLYKYNQYLKINTAGAIAITKLVREHQAEVQENIQILREDKRPGDFIEDPSTKEDKKEVITITGDNKREELTIEPESIILIQSVDNYVTIYFKDVKSVKTQMLRSTLTDIAQKLAEIPYLFRCHRGYIVNIRQIKLADGNAQGYKLTMDSLNLQVPVSRSNILQFRQLCSDTAIRA